MVQEKQAKNVGHGKVQESKPMQISRNVGIIINKPWSQNETKMYDTT